MAELTHLFMDMENAVCGNVNTVQATAILTRTWQEKNYKLYMLHNF